MKPEYDLVSFHIIEKFNNNNLITWTYPSISDSLKQSLLQSCFQHHQNVEFLYNRLEKQWFYLWERCKDHKTYALALVTKSFNPDKYQNFGIHLCNFYETNYKPIELVKVFLGVFTNGSYKIQQNGTQQSVQFNQNKLLENENYEELVNAFDVEIILIFNALLLKKRIIVYHPDFSCLLKQIEVITHLIEFKLRSPTDYLFPHVRSIANDLKGKSYFVAGSTDKSMNIKPGSYDVFVNLQNSSIKISPSSKDIFQMTKWHKDVATMLTSQENTNKSQDLNKKVSEMLSTLKTFAVASPFANEPPMVTIDALREKKLPPAMENFLINLALAENIMML